MISQPLLALGLHGWPRLMVFSHLILSQALERDGLQMGSSLYGPSPGQHVGSCSMNWSESREEIGRCTVHVTVRERSYKEEKRAQASVLRFSLKLFVFQHSRYCVSGATCWRSEVQTGLKSRPSAFTCKWVATREQAGRQGRRCYARRTRNKLGNGLV